jgi:hypothetical protein
MLYIPFMQTTLQISFSDSVNGMPFEYFLFNLILNFRTMVALESHLQFPNSLQ